MASAPIMAISNMRNGTNCDTTPFKLHVPYLVHLFYGKRQKSYLLKTWRRRRRWNRREKQHTYLRLSFAVLLIITLYYALCSPLALKTPHQSITRPLADVFFVCHTFSIIGNLCIVILCAHTNRVSSIYLTFDLFSAAEIKKTKANRHRRRCRLTFIFVCFL